MILFTNEGNPLGLKILAVGYLAKKDIKLKVVNFGS